MKLRKIVLSLYVCVCVFIKLEVDFGVCFSQTPFYILEKGLSLNTGLTDSARLDS